MVRKENGMDLGEVLFGLTLNLLYHSGDVFVAEPLVCRGLEHLVCRSSGVVQLTFRRAEAE
jgi:hypothetical protein